MAKIDKKTVEEAASKTGGSVTMSLGAEEAKAVATYRALDKRQRELVDLQRAAIDKARDIVRLADTGTDALTKLADHLAGTNLLGEAGRLFEAIATVRSLPSVARARGIVWVVGPAPPAEPAQG